MFNLSFLYMKFIYTCIYLYFIIYIYLYITTGSRANETLRHSEIL